MPARLLGTDPPSRFLSTIATTSVLQNQADLQLTVVPEPKTMIAGALLLLPFGASALRTLRKSRKA